MFNSEGGRSWTLPWGWTCWQLSPRLLLLVPSCSARS